MMAKAKSLEYDLRYLRAGLEVLDQYLLKEDVFWPIGVNAPEGEPEYPRLTLDGLLLARKRLGARQVPAGEKHQVDEVVSALDVHRSRWRVAWEKKAAECFRVRIRMWGDYLQEYRDNPGENADRYAYEVRLRAMLELLKSEFRSHDPAENELLAGLDGYLKTVLVAGGFIWEPEVQPGFPPTVYWFLYGKLS